MEKLLDRYLTREDRSESIVGIDCMLLRILASVGEVMCVNVIEKYEYKCSGAAYDSNIQGES